MNRKGLRLHKGHDKETNKILTTNYRGFYDVVVREIRFAGYCYPFVSCN